MRPSKEYKPATLVAAGGKPCLTSGEPSEPEEEYKPATIVAVGGESVASLSSFNDHVAADPRVEQVIIPLHDGLTVIRKKE